MKGLYFSITIAALMAYGCGGSSNKKSMQTNSAGISISPTLLATNLDPVCNMDMSQSKIADTALVNGKIYAFCNPGCKEEFKANPEKFLK